MKLRGTCKLLLGLPSGRYACCDIVDFDCLLGCLRVFMDLVVAVFLSEAF